MKTIASSTTLKRVFLSAIAVSSLYSGSLAFSQVNGVGPSDPGLFDNVINVPYDRNFGDEQGIGGDGQTTQVNVSDGGRIGLSFDVDSGVEFNVSGGTIGADFDASFASEVNVSGGVFGRFFRMTGDGRSGRISGGTFDSASFGASGSVVGREDQTSISGGSFGRGFSATSTVELVGGEFMLNGSEFLGDTISLSDGDVFSGTFADGSAFVFDAFESPSSGGSFSVDRLINTNLRRTALPTINLTPQIVDTATTQGSSLREGQTLTLRDGGELVNFEAVNATFNLEGGTLRSSAGFDSDGGGTFVGGVTNISGGDASENFRSLQGNVLNLSGGTIGRSFVSRDSTVNITGGSIGGAEFFNSTINLESGTIGGSSSFFDSEVTITGGAVGGSFRAVDSNVNVSGGIIDDFTRFDVGSVVNIEGGTFGFNTGALPGSNVTISGGNFGNDFSANDGSNVSISGGVFGDSINISPAAVELIGGEFVLNGAAYTDSTISLGEGDTFTGVLQDGSAFVFSDFVNDALEGVTLTTSSIAAPASNEFVVDTPAPAGAPQSLRNGQTLTVLEGGALANTFESVGGSINVAGGSLGNVTASGGTIQLSAGSIERTTVLDGGLLEVSGGSIERIALYSSQVDFTGGTQITSQSFRANDGSTVNVNGATIQGSVGVIDGELNISGDAVIEEASVTRGQVDISGGRIDGAVFREGSTVNVSAGEIGRLDVFGSQFTMTGGSVVPSGNNRISLAGDAATWSLLGGTVGSGAEVIQSATLEVMGGQIGRDLRIESSTLNVSGGQIGNDLEVTFFSDSNISGGTIGDRFVVGRESTVNITGGNIGNDFTVGRTPGFSTVLTGGTVNISGGQIGNGFNIGSDGTANISGGTFGSSVDAHSGSDVTISGGEFAEQFVANSGSTVKISGGNFGAGFLGSGTGVELQGGEFKLNGFDISAASEISISSSNVLTGVLADGSSFIFSNNSGDSITNVTISNVSLPTLDVAPIVVDTPSVGLPSGLRAGQSLTLQDGGVLGNNFEAVDASVNVNGGAVGDGFGTARSTVSVDGGSIGNSFQSHAGSVINVDGGTIGDEFSAHSGSVVTINDGVIGDGFDARSGSEVYFSGGRVGQGFVARSGSLVRINGGTIGRGVDLAPASDAELLGGEFQLNGVAFTESTISLGDGDVFTGTLEDGSVFVFADEVSDRLVDVKLNQTALPDVDTTPFFVSAAMPNAPSGLRAGQTLTLEQGGVIGVEFEAVGGVVNVNGGSFTDDIAFGSTIFNLNDGSIAGDAVAVADSEFNLFGGTIDGLLAGVGSEINIYGGSVESRLTANAGSAVDVFATEFFINGDEVEFTDFDTPLLIENRNFSLSGTFLDGSEFQYFVGSSLTGDLRVSSGATFQLNLVAAVPEPNAAFLLAISGMMLFGKRRRA